MSDALPAEPRPAHRPPLPFEQRIPKAFTDQLLELIADGQSLNEAVATLGRQYSRPAVLAWAKESAEFGDRLERARAIGRQCWADDQMRIADDASGDRDAKGAGDTAAVKRSELRIRTRQWLLERLEPETYSPRQRVDHQHTHRHELDPDTASMLSELRDELQAERGKVIEGQAQEIESASDEG